VRFCPLWIAGVLALSSCRRESTPPPVGSTQQALWQATTRMSDVRHLHSATRLPDGKVLIAGGADGTLDLASAELFDPATNTWAAAAPMGLKRRGHAATLLPNGKVLITGGSNNNTLLPSAEIYSPATNTWAAVPSMISARVNHTATLLADGRVLVAGGLTSAAPAELYDPGTNSWTASSAVAPRFFATATLLPNGKVLVAGGTVSGPPLASAELYDPATNSWSAAATAPLARSHHGAVLLPTGKVLVTGGKNVSGLTSCELYDPATNSWAPAASLSDARLSHATTLLADGRVLASGGLDLSSAELYDATANTWTRAAEMTVRRFNHSATELLNGKVLVAGGENTASLPWAELYVLAVGGVACTTAASCPSGHCVDGLCCDTACSGACDSCDLPGGLGICSPNPSGTVGSPSCTPYACSGTSSACAVTCSVAANCAPGNYCLAGVCTPLRNRGTACTTADQCITGLCTDGRCCTSACVGACNTCDASGTCVVWTAATGLPAIPGNPSCSPFVCSGTLNCPASCTTDVSCVSTHTCDAGACVPRLPLGAGCSVAKECASQICVNGVCCDSSCSGQCDRCDAPSSPGICSLQPAGFVGAPLCSPYLCTGMSKTCPALCTNDNGCTLTHRCENNKCVLRLGSGKPCTDGTLCSSGNCVDGICCNSACTGPCQGCSVVDGGAGICGAKPSGFSGNPACTPYVCQGLAGCPTDCSNDSQCVSTHFCSQGVCLERKSQGSACDAGNSCASNNCSDGVCCNSKCSGGCDVCDAPGAEGTCTLLPELHEGRPSCAPYLCPGNDGRCRGTCVTDDHCVKPNFCSHGFCTTTPVVRAPPGPAGCGCQTADGAAIPFFALLLALLSYRRATSARTTSRSPSARSTSAAVAARSTTTPGDLRPAPRGE
jgi:hypothetical protein